MTLKEINYIYQRFFHKDKSNPERIKTQRGKIVWRSHIKGTYVKSIHGKL